jgi:hypothetical protein
MQRVDTALSHASFSAALIICRMQASNCLAPHLTSAAEKRWGGKMLKQRSAPCGGADF